MRNKNIVMGKSIRKVFKYNRLLYNWWNKVYIHKTRVKFLRNRKFYHNFLFKKIIYNKLFYNFLKKTIYFFMFYKNIYYKFLNTSFLPVIFVKTFNNLEKNEIIEVKNKIINNYNLIFFNKNISNSLFLNFHGLNYISLNNDKINPLDFNKNLIFSNNINDIQNFFLLKFIRYNNVIIDNHNVLVESFSNITFWHNCKFSDDFWTLYLLEIYKISIYLILKNIIKNNK